MSDQRTPLGTIPGRGPSERVLVTLCAGRHGGSAIELCEQHHGEGIGWFDQRRLTLDAGQWQTLRALLGGGDAGADRLAPEAGEAPAILAFPGPRETIRTRRPALGEPA